MSRTCPLLPGLCPRGQATPMSCDLQPPHAYHYDDTGNGDPTFGQTDLPPPADPSRPLVSGQAPDRLLPELTSFQPLGDVLSPPVTSPPSACQLSFPEDPALTMATHTGHLPFPEGTATTATSTCQPAVSPQDKDRDPRPSSRSRERRRLNYRTGDDGLTAGPCPPRVDTPCDVCGEPASGHYFGALVCLPCKVHPPPHKHTFFTLPLSSTSFCSIVTVTAFECPRVLTTRPLTGGEGVEAPRFTDSTVVAAVVYLFMLARSML